MTSSAPPPRGSAANPIRRLAARVLLIDGAGRVLLMHGFNPAEPAVTYWFTVGGGLEDGEGLIDGAARELREETGLAVPAQSLRGPVHTDVTNFPYDGQWYRQEQEYFVCRVPSWEVSVDGFDVEERRSVDDHRWWSVADLTTTDETVYPSDLADIVRTILES